MKRSTLRLLAALSAMLLIAGCDRSREPAAAAQPDEAAQTVLRMWHIMNYEGPREVLQEAVIPFRLAALVSRW